MMANTANVQLLKGLENANLFENHCLHITRQDGEYDVNCNRKSYFRGIVPSIVSRAFGYGADHVANLQTVLNLKAIVEVGREAFIQEAAEGRLSFPKMHVSLANLKERLTRNAPLDTAGAIQVAIGEIRGKLINMHKEVETLNARRAFALLSDPDLFRNNNLSIDKRGQISLTPVRGYISSFIQGSSNEGITSGKEDETARKLAEWITSYPDQLSELCQDGIEGLQTVLENLKLCSTALPKPVPAANQGEKTTAQEAMETAIGMVSRKLIDIDKEIDTQNARQAFALLSDPNFFRNNRLGIDQHGNISVSPIRRPLFTLFGKAPLAAKIIAGKEAETAQKLAEWVESYPAELKELGQDGEGKLQRLLDNLYLFSDFLAPATCENPYAKSIAHAALNEAIFSVADARDASVAAAPTAVANHPSRAKNILNGAVSAVKLGWRASLITGKLGFGLTKLTVKVGSFVARNLASAASACIKANLEMARRVHRG